MPASQEKIQQILDHEPALCGKHGWHTDWTLCGKIAICYKCRREYKKSRWKNNRIAEQLEVIKSKDWACDIDELFILDLIIKQNNKCALSGVIFSKTALPSIDRIDSNRGYTRENVQIVVQEINYMKRNMSQELFIALCKAVGRKHGQT